MVQGYGPGDDSSCSAGVCSILGAWVANLFVGGRTADSAHRAYNLRVPSSRTRSSWLKPRNALHSWKPILNISNLG